MTIPDRLAEIRAREQAATDGPWWAWDRGVGYEIGVGPAAADGGPDRYLPEGQRTSIGRAEDAEFIAGARQDVPWLLDRLTAVLDLHSPRRGVDVDATGVPFTYAMCDECDEWYPCTTARAAGITDDQQDGKVGA